MSNANVEVRVFNLEGEDSDLIIQGVCGDCRAQLWSSTYRKEVYQHMTKPELHAMVASDVREHAQAIRQHTCQAH